MQYKTLINPSFLVLMLDVQDHLKSGWEINPNNLPANTFVYYEVNLIKDDNSGVFLEKPKGPENEFFKSTSVPPAKKPGRPVQNKATQ